MQVAKRTPVMTLWVLVWATATCLAAPRVELELIRQGGFPLGGERRWIEALRDLENVHIRIRSARPGDRMEVKRRGSKDAPSYQVTGMLTAGNQLQVPGGTFSLGDRGKIAAWLQRLRDEGQEGLTAPRGAFGLTSKQLVAAHDELATPVRGATKGVDSLLAVQKVTADLTLGLTLDAAARVSLARQEEVRDELEGLSSGTALAAILRPQGLALVLEKATASKVQLRITDSRKVKEFWPVGWPPEKSPRESMPDLFKFLNVEIQDVPLAEALEAIQARLSAPFLLDHNSLARHRIDPAQLNVSMPPGRTYYKRIIDRLLSQAKLKSEIRVDENQRPFLWISTIKR